MSNVSSNTVSVYKN